MNQPEKSLSTASPDDRSEAAELLARYGELIDAGDFAGVGQLLSEAVVEGPDGTPIAQGSAEIEALYVAMTRRFEDGTPRTAHIITNIIVEVVGVDTFEMRSRFTVFQATDQFPLQPVVVGRYVDKVKRIDNRLAFVSRRMIPELWGDASAHLVHLGT